MQAHYRIRDITPEVRIGASAAGHITGLEVRNGLGETLAATSGATQTRRTKSLRANHGSRVLTYAFRAEACHRKKIWHPTAITFKHGIGWTPSSIQPIAPISSNRSMARRLDV